MKLAAMYMMAAFYTAAGINHFINPRMYLKIMPPWLPNPVLWNYASGGCEILFAILLIPESTRSVGAWLMIALLIAVFPANIQMSINFWKSNNPYFWLTIARLPLQFVLIWWAWLYTRPLL